MPAHSPVGAKIYVGMAGLLTCPLRLRLLGRVSSNGIMQKKMKRDLQQRVLFRIHTGFPFRRTE